MCVLCTFCRYASMTILWSGCAFMVVLVLFCCALRQKLIYRSGTLCSWALLINNVHGRAKNYSHQSPARPPIRPPALRPITFNFHLSPQPQRTAAQSGRNNISASVGSRSVGRGTEFSNSYLADRSRVHRLEVGRGTALDISLPGESSSSHNTTRWEKLGTNGRKRSESCSNSSSKNNNRSSSNSSLL